jgi:hypothetical protein
LPVCTTIIIVAPKGRRRPTLLYSNRSRSKREPASNRSKLAEDQSIDSSIPRMAILPFASSATTSALWGPSVDLVEPVFCSSVLLSLLSLALVCCLSVLP